MAKLDFYKDHEETITVLDFGICEFCGQDLSEKGCSNENCINHAE